jgi:hypothetical protein
MRRVVMLRFAHMAAIAAAVCLAPAALLQFAGLN